LSRMEVHKVLTVFPHMRACMCGSSSTSP
jgi:hypothetical protein